VAAAGPGANLILAGLSAAAMTAVAGPEWLARTLQASLALNLLLGLFNLIPVPPLDGSKVLAALLPERWALPLAGLRRRQSPVKWISHRWLPGPPKPPADPGV